RIRQPARHHRRQEQRLGLRRRHREQSHPGVQAESRRQLLSMLAPSDPSNAPLQIARHRRTGRLRLRGRLLLAQLALAGLVGLSRVTELLKRAGIDADANPAVLALAAFAHYAMESLDARKADVEATQALSALVERFDQQIHDLDSLLIALETQGETRMSEREDRAKTLIQSSRATV